MRVVIKIGTNLLTSKDGSLNAGRMKSFVSEIAALIKSKHQVVLVTSGAIGAGMGKLGWKSRPATLKEKQALAAVGQPLLMEAYHKQFSKHKLTIAQVLLTRQDFEDRQRYLNAKNTLLTLLELGVVPIVNENDTVAVEEINIGDNDTLAALVAVKVDAEALLLLTDVDGLYKGLPGKSELIPLVEKITPEIEKYASGESKSGRGTGGMKTKLIAAKIATSAGVRMVIGSGLSKGVITKVGKGENAGTIFLPRQSLDARQCWIAYGTKFRGRVVIDNGAALAVTQKGKSLLPSGILRIEGVFKAGDTISVVARDGKELARGLSYYSSQDIDKIKGKNSSAVYKILPNAAHNELIHRDNLVVL